ncbi:hypothetical protein OSTOST_09109 [Ostertagia ostertagi]
MPSVICGAYILSTDAGRRQRNKREDSVNDSVGTFSAKQPDLENSSPASNDSPELTAPAFIYPSDVLRILKALKCSTSATIDGIPQIVYKRCAHSLYRPLTMIFNASLLFSEVPSLWKESIVTAIPKTSDAILLSSFRPISITPPPVKIDLDTPLVTNAESETPGLKKILFSKGEIR